MTRASWRPNPEAVCDWAPASKEPQARQSPGPVSSLPNPLPPNQAANPPPNPEGTPPPSALRLTGGVSEERVPGAQETPAHPRGACCGGVPLKPPSAPAPDLEPAPLEPCHSHLLEPRSCTWGRKGLWHPRVDIGSNSPAQAFLLSLAQQSPGLLGLGPRRGWGLHPPPRRALPPGLYLPLSKAFFVQMPT